ncbi:PD-(D/E)XK nuclease-like domain-containing protein [Methylobacterium sp. 1973]|uniref:PD-(D/E)XK nuclease-like domain-containing protein n=1 Tax=Methylobacterium sp. 1973 TaxID=3156421 RepID=UPI003390DAEB
MDAVTPAHLVTVCKIPDGIHFGLDEAAYHADPALGSTDLKQLATEPAAYWYGSALNPHRPAEDDDTPARLVGRAVHKFVLEGPPAFLDRFERYPEGDDLLVTADHLGAWLKDRDVKPGKTKAASVELIRERCLADGVEPPRMLDHLLREAADASRAVLKAADYDRITAAGCAVLDNPHLVGSFEGGAAEVSLFWTDEIGGEPVRRKARFDYLKPRAVVDLKSTRPKDGMPFVASCRRALAQWSYPTQAAAYLQARARLAAFVSAGQVYGDHDPAWLARVAAAEDYALVFVFWASTGAPLTWGGVMSPGSALVGVGEESVRRALDNFTAARRAHGDGPWVDHQPLEEIDLDHLPAWFGAAF